MDTRWRAPEDSITARTSRCLRTSPNLADQRHSLKGILVAVAELGITAEGNLESGASVVGVHIRVAAAAEVVHNEGANTIFDRHALGACSRVLSAAGFTVSAGAGGDRPGGNERSHNDRGERRDLHDEWYLFR